MSTVIKVKINELDTSHPMYEEGYRYYAQLFTSVDGGENFYYTGIGRWTFTKEEAMTYKSLKETKKQ